MLPQLHLPLHLLHIFVCNSLTFRAGQKCRRGNLTFWTGQRAEAAAVVTSLVACLECLLLLLLLLCLVINWLSSWLDQAKWQRLIYCAYAPWTMAGSTHKFRASCWCCCCNGCGSCCLRKLMPQLMMTAANCATRCEAHHHRQRQRQRCLSALPGSGELHFHGS